ncbi:chorismate transformation enzyme, FkbO/Hyg5 family [Puniceicoccus vermicola]|uniref:Chorismatase FkbO/Hyg5-like N-terminal domain-containing protein n=1 Tax=Puniceicoccus vermicola TaxID=388746 RepID=A0A7X1AWD1_9BACT|nr:hypothetical protein [Puniceicoccus vermicola]MBC2601052.1 hypothetical protein [Puniceicoccus vermicola]
MPPNTPSEHQLRILFDGTHAEILRQPELTSIILPLPFLGGQVPFSSKAVPVKTDDEQGWNVYLLPHLGIHLVIGIQPIGDSLESIVEERYRDLLTFIEDNRLYRVWNYIPKINEERGGMENYRAFCSGRSKAFHAIAGDDSVALMPSASGLGCHGEDFIVLALFGPDKVDHIENPLQVPAYRYPKDYGPRPPSFSRGTIIHRGVPISLISGTAAVRGHESVGGDDIRSQTEETIRNLQSILAEREKVVPGLVDEQLHRHFTVYLRDRHDRAVVEELLGAHLLRDRDEVLWLEADICRAELKVEIEVALYPLFGK